MRWWGNLLYNIKSECSNNKKIILFFFSGTQAKPSQQNSRVCGEEGKKN